MQWILSIYISIISKLTYTCCLIMLTVTVYVVYFINCNDPTVAMTMHWKINVTIFSRCRFSYHAIPEV